METRWKEICYLIRSNKTSYENLFQSEIVNIFEKIGWSRFNNEIEEKRKIDIGSASSIRPDIIIKSQVKDLFVVELKKPSAQYSNRNDSQLFSYMRQLRLKIGILINDRIHVFFDDQNCSVPVEIMNIEFDESADDGILFLEFFSKQTFDHEAVINYCDNQLKKLEVIDLISSDEYREKIFDLIKTDLRESFNQKVIELAFANIDLSITNTLDLSESKGTQIVDKLGNVSPISSDYNDTNSEVEKVKRRVPRWFNNPNQTNSKILIKAMKYLSSTDNMSFRQLEDECKGIDKFRGNFEQMANFGIKNHGKVFNRSGDILSLWEPVIAFVKESYFTFNKQRS